MTRRDLIASSGAQRLCGRVLCVIILFAGLWFFAS
jgi:hypothetical protein